MKHIAAAIGLAFILTAIGATQIHLATSRASTAPETAEAITAPADDDGGAVSLNQLEGGSDQDAPSTRAAEAEGSAFAVSQSTAPAAPPASAPAFPTAQTYQVCGARGCSTYSYQRQPAQAPQQFQRVFRGRIFGRR